MAGKLALVAGTGLLGGAVLLAIGVGLSGPDLLHLQPFRGLQPSTCGPAAPATAGPADAAPPVTRVLPLDSADSLTIALPASVRYRPGGKAEAVISGDPVLAARVRLAGGRLSLDCNPGPFAPRLTIRLSGPAIARWVVLGSGDLDLAAIDQPELRLQVRGSGRINASGAANASVANRIDVDVEGSGDVFLRDIATRSARVAIRGSGDVTATGSVDRLTVDIAGSGDALLREWVAQSARITIRGSGDAQVTAQQEAEVDIAGSGDAELGGHPVLKEASTRGSGRIIRRP